MPPCFFLACHKLTSDLGFGILISRQHKNDLSVEKNNIVELFHGFPEIRKPAETSKKFLASQKKKKKKKKKKLINLWKFSPVIGKEKNNCC